MNKGFIIAGFIALLPMTIICCIFGVMSFLEYGFAIPSYDVVGTHYWADIGSYPPVVPLINSVAKIVFGELYDLWWIILALLVSVYIPYILFFEITKQHRYGFVYVYGTAIPLIQFMIGLIPQAIMICLILLLVARPKWFIAIFIFSIFVHNFGFAFILMAKAWLWFDGHYKNID